MNTSALAVGGDAQRGGIAALGHVVGLWAEFRQLQRRAGRAVLVMQVGERWIAFGRSAQRIARLMRGALDLVAALRCGGRPAKVVAHRSASDVRDFVLAAGGSIVLAYAGSGPATGWTLRRCGPLALHADPRGAGRREWRRFVAERNRRERKERLNGHGADERRDGR